MTSAAASDNRMKKLRTNYARLDGWSSRKAPALFPPPDRSPDYCFALLGASRFDSDRGLNPANFFVDSGGRQLWNDWVSGRVFSVVLIVILAFSSSARSAGLLHVSLPVWPTSCPPTDRISDKKSPTSVGPVREVRSRKFKRQLRR